MRSFPGPVSANGEFRPSNLWFPAILPFGPAVNSLPMKPTPKSEIMICVAPVPGEKQEEKFPGQLQVPAELIQCEAAGAAIGHIHARNEQLLQSVNREPFVTH